MKIFILMNVLSLLLYSLVSSLLLSSESFTCVLSSFTYIIIIIITIIRSIIIIIIIRVFVMIIVRIIIIIIMIQNFDLSLFVLIKKDNMCCLFVCLSFHLSACLSRFILISFFMKDIMWWECIGQNIICEKQIVYHHSEILTNLEFIWIRSEDILLKLFEWIRWWAQELCEMSISSCTKLMQMFITRFKWICCRYYVTADFSRLIYVLLGSSRLRSCDDRAVVCSSITVKMFVRFCCLRS